MLRILEETTKYKMANNKKKQDMYEVVSDLVGEDTLPIIKVLKKRPNTSEFKISEETNIAVNRIRNILYRLQSQNLVTYYKKKDRIKGWYISYWSFNAHGLKDAAINLERKKLEELKERLAKEEANKGLFYICKNICLRADFDTATNLNFLCPECGNLLNQHDNTETIAALKKKIMELERRK